MNIRIFPANSSIPNVANGRSYDPTQAYLDVIDVDAAILCTNGWTRLGGPDGVFGVGPTSARPVLGTPGALVSGFYDTTVGDIVTWIPTWPRLGNNGGWVNSVGASV